MIRLVAISAVALAAVAGSCAKPTRSVQATSSPVETCDPHTAPDADLPRVRATPDHGPPGTLVAVEGYGFSRCHWARLIKRGPWMMVGQHPNDEDCEVNPVIEPPNDAQVDEDGHLTGRFRIGKRAGCKQMDRVTAIPPGDYSISLSCYPCFVGTFRITEP